MSDPRILFLLFLSYSAVGWLCESIYCSIPAHRFINRGFLSGPVCPVYGVGALLAVFLLTPIAWSVPLLYLGGALVTSVLEYVTGWLLETILHGRVCLKNSLLFGVMCVVLMRVIHPVLLGWVEKLSPLVLSIVSVVLLAVFAADVVVSVLGALQLRGKLEDLQQILDELRERTESAVSEQRSAVIAAVDTLGQRAQAGREEAVDRLRERQAHLEQSLRFAHRRLLAAFPTMRVRTGREAIARLREAAARRRKKKD